MQAADPVSVQCLRRTSRTFMYLFAEACPSQATTRSYPWPTPRNDFLSSDQRKKLVTLLARDAYRHDCLAARRAPD